MSKLAMEMLGVRSMATEWEVAREGEACQLYTDASVALGIAQRQGAGEMQRINVRSVWLQENSLQGSLQYSPS